MEFPEDLLYTKDHEWIKINGQTAIIGITDFAQKELGDIVYVEVETQGETLEQHAVFGTVEAVKTVSDLFIPVSGKVLEVNPKIISNPELANKDPYGDGWIIQVNISDPSQTASLLYAADYKKLIGVG